MDEQIKVCIRCIEPKSLDEFSKKKHGEKVYYNSWCKKCANEYSRDHYAANKEKRRADHKAWRENNPDKLRGYWLKGTYGITLEDYDRMYAEQGGVCIICQQPDGVLCVDHDHACCPGNKSCGECVRGLLCSDCNLSLGKFGDDIIRLERAIAYLKKEI